MNFKRGRFGEKVRTEFSKVNKISPSPTWNNLHLTLKPNGLVGVDVFITVAMISSAS